MRPRNPDAQYPVGKGYDPNLDSNSPKFKDSTGGGASGGGRAKPATHGVGGGVISKKKRPDLAVSMKQMLRRKGG